MTHDELLDKVQNKSELEDCWMALQKVVELHKPQPTTIPSDPKCAECSGLDWSDYPCQTIQVIEKALN